MTAPPQEGRLERSPSPARAAWLNGRLLLVCWPPPVGEEEIPPRDAAVTMSSGEQAIEGEAHSFVYARQAPVEPEGRMLSVIRFPLGALPAHWPSFELRSSWGPLTIESHSLVDLESMLGDELRDLGPQARDEAQRFLLSVTAGDLGRAGGFSLAKSLHQIREALREPLPRLAIDKDQPQAVVVDKLLAVDDRCFWIMGWMRDEDGTVDRLTVVSPEGQRAELTDPFRLRRQDVEQVYGGFGRPDGKHGFVSFFELDAPSPLAGGWLLELRDAAGSAGIEVDASPAVRDPSAATDVLLAHFAADVPSREELRVNHLEPAFTRLQVRQRQSTAIEDVVQYGTAPPSPTVSVVVTLYRRIDFLQHQLLQFAQDPAMRGADLIYVLDSPELAGPLSELASAMHAFHGVPMRVAKLTRNSGYATANNLGASLARGKLLLLLNSDVLPDHPGWLERMAGFHDATPGIGALGPKLLFEDDSIQHAGMYFEREPTSATWGDLHYYKGMARNFGPANVDRPVPAVTGACLMVDRALFAEAGGLSHTYLKGGYEDSDLCLRLIAKGLRNWYLAGVELYHLEGQVHPTPSADASVQYATWLQTRRYGPLIEQVMADQAPAAAAALEDVTSG